MTISQAVKELIESEEFKIDARKENYLRTFLRRHRNNELGSGAAVEMLLRYGYTVEIKGRKKVVSKK